MFVRKKRKMFSTVFDKKKPFRKPVTVLFYAHLNPTLRYNVEVSGYFKGSNYSFPFITKHQVRYNIR